jgi:hypothetical protein
LHTSDLRMQGGNSTPDPPSDHVFLADQAAYWMPSSSRFDPRSHAVLGHRRSLDSKPSSGRRCWSDERVVGCQAVLENHSVLGYQTIVWLQVVLGFGVIFTYEVVLRRGGCWIWREISADGEPGGLLHRRLVGRPSTRTPTRIRTRTPTPLRARLRTRTRTGMPIGTRSCGRARYGRSFGGTRVRSRGAASRDER